MQIIRKIVEIDEALCDGCGQCVSSCEEGAIQIVNGKANVIEDRYCDGLGACIGHCPKGALKIIERIAENFDEKAAHAHVKSMKQSNNSATLTCGCPSSLVQSIKQGCKQANQAKTQHIAGTELTNWPVQIRLIPATAPFLKDADLLVLADCTAVAFPNLHSDLIANKVVMMGCPKFDDQSLYVERFREIFDTAKPKSLTVAIMEVPCCSQMLGILQKAISLSRHQEMASRIITITTKGEIR